MRVPSAETPQPGLWPARPAWVVMPLWVIVIRLLWKKWWLSQMLTLTIKQPKPWMGIRRILLSPNSPLFWLLPPDLLRFLSLIPKNQVPFQGLLREPQESFTTQHHVLKSVKTHHPQMTMIYQEPVVIIQMQLKGVRCGNYQCCSETRNWYSRRPQSGWCYGSILDCNPKMSSVFIWWRGRIFTGTIRVRTIGFRHWHPSSHCWPCYSL